MHQDPNPTLNAVTFLVGHDSWKEVMALLFEDETNRFMSAYIFILLSDKNF